MHGNRSDKHPIKYRPAHTTANACNNFSRRKTTANRVDNSSEMNNNHDSEDNSAAWLQIGMSSTIDPSRFERSTQTIIAAIDVSCSMQWNYGSDETDFINAALDKGLLLTPGRGFGKAGIGWVRASVTAPDDVVDGAIDIITTKL